VSGLFNLDPFNLLYVLYMSYELMGIIILFPKCVVMSDIKMF
jgi:hypothetical protein